MPARLRHPATILIHCPSCRSTQRAQPVGVGHLGREQRQLVECLTPECGLIWAVTRTVTPHAA